MNNRPRKFNDSVKASTYAKDSIDKPVQISAQELHKYVLGLVGIFLLVVGTYPTAMSRVAQKEKFAPYQSHLKSLTLEYKSAHVPNSNNSTPQ
jgi:hypothetical protein